MKFYRDANLELMTLPELRRERLALLDKIRLDRATVKDARRFGLLSGLIVIFEQAKLAAGFKVAADVYPNRILPKAKGVTSLAVDCDICKSAKATVFTTSVKEGKLHKDNFCGDCAARASQDGSPLFQCLEKLSA